MKLILFDLGDTLIYREKTIEEFDLELIMSCLKDHSREEICKSIAFVNRVFPEINTHRLSSFLFPNLEIEIERQKAYYLLILENLNTRYPIIELIHKRYEVSPYKLFDGVIDLLDLCIQDGRYVLGIATNGRPSRRLILKSLNIDQFFIDKYYFISDELRMHKPQEDFYKLILNVGAEYENITLIDDDQNNILGFQQLGGLGINISGKEICDYLEVFSRIKSLK